MREPLSTFQKRLVGDRVPSDLLKLILTVVLKGLDYLHTHCRLIHTDLKPDNILIGLESQAPLDEYVENAKTNPGPAFTAGDRFIFPTRRFGRLQGDPGIPKIADFGTAVWGNVARPHNHIIQPNLLRAPEVILRAGWSYSADIWNLGVMLWDLLEDRTLFKARDRESKGYKSEIHLAEMISLLGNPPSELLERGDKTTEYFTADGEALYKDDGTSYSPRFETCIDSLTGEDKLLFIDFVKRMLQWMPEDRASAAELLDDPWLTSDEPAD